MLKKFTYLASITLILFFTYLLVDIFTFQNNRQNLVEQQGLATTLQLRNEVDAILAKIASEGASLADQFGARDYDKQEVETLIRDSALSIPELQGVTACYEPEAFSSSQRLYCPYYDKSTENILAVEESYDYTAQGEGTIWYTGVRDNGPNWVEPYYGQAAQDWFVDYGIPFYHTSGPLAGQVKGTITMSFIASGFKNLVHSMSLGKTGHGLITSTEGTFLAYPINEYVGTTKLTDISATENQVELNEAYSELLAGNTGFVEFFSDERQNEALFYYDQIPTSGWGIGLMFYKDDLLQDHARLNHKYIRIGLIFSLLLLCLLAMYYNKDYLDRGEIWKLSVFCSFLLLSNIFLVGYLQHSSKRSQLETESAPIVDMGALDTFVSQLHASSDEMHTERLREIPTGIYIHRMEFQDSYNLNIGASIWQKYPVDLIDDIEIGFDLPQISPFAEASSIEESYREVIPANGDQQGYMLIGWNVRVTLLLNFEYSDYPLDKRHIDLEISPLNTTDFLVFTPDLGSYNYTNPARKSGLDPLINISGSEVLESYFNFSVDTFDTDFGFDNKGLFEDIPTLHYNINLRRNLLNSFITSLIPILVSLLMMFILLHACGKTKERQGIIESMAAFFFVLIFSHIDLRKEIVTADLIYIEYFYFATYLMIVLSTWNLITYSKDQSPIFDYNENQLFKAGYFPFFLLIIHLVTLMKFY